MSHHNDKNADIQTVQALVNTVYKIDRFGPATFYSIPLPSQPYDLIFISGATKNNIFNCQVTLETSAFTMWSSECNKNFIVGITVV